MKSIYREVLADFDRRIAHMQGVRDQVASLADADDNAVGTRRRGPAKVGRAKSGGGDQVVLEAIRDGANTLPLIITMAKVKPSNAQAAVRRLRTLGKVVMKGNKRFATYEVKKGR